MKSNFIKKSILVLGSFCVALPIFATTETHQSDHKGVLLKEIIQGNGLPNEMVGEVASKVPLIDI